MTITQQMMARAKVYVAQHLPGWSVEWDRAKQRWGCCHPYERKITFSRPLFEAAASMEEFEKTLNS